MSTIVAIMDRPGWDQSTDVLVAVLPRRRRLVWIPRDLFAPAFRMRINDVFAAHGHEGLIAAVRAEGVEVERSVCLQRGLTEALLADVSVEVPVERTLEYWYPLHPHALMKDGKRLVRFDPPSERLEGLRVHEWIGARHGVGRFAGDLERIRRQQVFVPALLRSGFDPRPLLAARPDLWSASAEGVRADLEAVRPDWGTRMIGRVLPATSDGRKVVLRRRLPGPPGRWHAARVARRYGATLD